MGTFGPGIFSDDIAMDVRDRYRDLVSDGLSGTQATDVILTEYPDAQNDPDIQPVIWLALAATQWRCGRLEPRVQERALQIIERGEDLVRWQEAPAWLNKRKAALGKLRATLLSPQPPEKRIHKRFRNTCEWEIGEVIGYRLLSGKFIALRVIGHHSDLGGTAPIFELLDWCGQALPSEEELFSAGIRTGSRGQTSFMVGRTSQRELPRLRVHVTGIHLPPLQKEGSGYYVTLWRWFDQFLERVFGLC